MECSATWINSTTVNEIDVRNSGAFTTLPVRISKYNEIAITAAQKLACIWDTIRCGGVSSRTLNVGRNPLPLVVPEALPERMATAVKLIELGYLCDGMCSPHFYCTQLTLYCSLFRSIGLAEQGGNLQHVDPMHGSVLPSFSFVVLLPQCMQQGVWRQAGPATDTDLRGGY